MTWDDQHFPGISWNLYMAKSVVDKPQPCLDHGSQGFLHVLNFENRTIVIRSYWCIPMCRKFKYLSWSCRWEWTWQVCWLQFRTWLGATKNAVFFFASWNCIHQTDMIPKTVMSWSYGTQWDREAYWHDYLETSFGFDKAWGWTSRTWHWGSTSVLRDSSLQRTIIKRGRERLRERALSKRKIEEDVLKVCNPVRMWRMLQLQYYHPKYFDIAPGIWNFSLPCSI